MISCERPRKRSASDAGPSSVSKRYSFSTRTHGNSRRFRVTSSPRRVNAFSSLRSSSRAARHSSRVPTLCLVISSPGAFLEFVDDRREVLKFAEPARSQRVWLFESGGASLQQRFEVGDYFRPAARYGGNEFRCVTLDGVRDGEL